MRLNEPLDEYQQVVTAWMEQVKKEAAAVHKLQQAVAAGNARDLDKLRAAALAANASAQQRAQECGPFEFDAAAYLAGGGFLQELQAAATQAGVRLYERDGVVFSYPVVLHLEPELAAVRIDKKLVAGIRPSVLAAQLKKLQSKEPRAKSNQFLETLFRVWSLLDQGKGVAQPLSEVYKTLTLLPGLGSEYTPLDFARDIYFLDTSGNTTTKNGWQLSLSSSTGTREGRGVIKFVGRDGLEKAYQSVRFSSPS